MESFKFGDVIKYREKEYVFLVQTPEIVYAAQILDDEKTKSLDDFYSRKAKGNKQSKYDGNMAFCFVILHYTEEYKDRAACFKDSQKDALDFIIEKIGTLDNKDIVAIKDDILMEGSPVYLELKELVSKLDIK